MYYNARFYDPSIGRFLTADTIVPDMLNAQAYNRYAYVINNPIKYTDPTGHFWHENGGKTGKERVDERNDRDKDDNDGIWKKFVKGAKKLYNNFVEWQNKHTVQTHNDEYGTNFKTWVDYKKARDAYNNALKEWYSASDTFWKTGVFELSAESFLAMYDFGYVGPIVQEMGFGYMLLRPIARFLPKFSGKFFKGAQYTQKVRIQMARMKDIRHAFPKSVDGYAQAFGTKAFFKGADGKLYQRLELSGHYLGKSGTFEYIKDIRGFINHRYLRP